jgi:hypothetical protein
VVLPQPTSMPQNQVLEYHRLLHSHSAELPVQTLRRLALLKVEMAKHRLLSVQPEELRPVQAEAKVWNDILQMIDNAPLFDKQS